MSRKAGPKAGPQNAAAKHRSRTHGSRRTPPPARQRTSLRQMRATIAHLEQQLAQLEERIDGLEWVP